MKSSMIIHPDELSKAWIDRLTDAGIDTVGIHSCGGKNAAKFLEDLISLMKTKEYCDLIDYAHSRGLEVEYELHTAGYLMPRSLFETHPEYFRMNENGERTNDWNFCVSNPDAMDYFAIRSTELALSLYGSNHNFYFWMDDGHGLYCHCPKCKQLSASDQQLLVVNRMVKEIRKQIPDARVAYLAYQDTLVPPSKVSVADGVFLEYAPFDKYTANGDNAAELISREKEMITSLMCLFHKEHPKVLEYWYDNSLFSRWEKPPVKFVLNENAMKSDIAEYRRLGFQCISTFACFLGKDYEDLYGEVNILPFAKNVI